ncbi:anhydro-N-acetylmuramic acid kinase [Vibrio sinaloensis]|uniref:anhydro-N-acetylmuramic acid kinase n=1 Tax=Photobacterium sp. (strain ATCC 43367) TaxID=379097 RepID=UPI002F3ED9BE
MTTKERYIGVMSGTSLDGVDTVIIEMDSGQPKLLAANDYPYPEQLKQRVLNVCTGQATNLVDIGQLDHELGVLYANAIQALLDKSGYQAEQICAIGNHGQTVYHNPSAPFPFTIQLGDANIIAARTGITTIADFRRKDMALGGQGAPLVPAFHQALFEPKDATTVILNIGGIANISVLQPGKAVLGYDTGPGNMLMDAWCQKQLGLAFDRGAQFALQGDIHQLLLNDLLSEPYFALPAPKSTGRELFNLEWLNSKLAEHSVSAEDVQRTLCEFSALTIAQQVEAFASGLLPELLVCGGGARNPLLMDRLQTLLPQWKVATTDSRGIDGDNMEAMAFAWLAYRRMHNLPSNLPEVTGASKAVSLGVMYFADN